MNLWNCRFSVIKLRGEAIGCDQFHLVLMRSSGELPPRPLEKVHRRRCYANSNLEKTDHAECAWGAHKCFSPRTSRQAVYRDDSLQLLCCRQDAARRSISRRT